MFKDSSYAFRNYDHDECAGICRTSSSCIYYLYSVKMQIYSKHDSENGCWLFYKTKHGKETWIEDVDNEIEISCEKINIVGDWSMILPLKKAISIHL